MQVTIRLFAALRELAASELVEDFEGDAVSLAELRTRLAERYPALRPHLERVAIAVNEEYARSDAPPLRDGDRVALINPVAGGATPAGADRETPSDKPPAVLVTGEPLDARALRDLVRTDASGAVVLFEGVVRDHHEGRAVERLEYEAYAEMAEREIARVIEEVRAEAVADGHTLHRVAVHHRVGALAIGDPAIIAAVSAAHREEAFRAAARLVDRVKETAPIWKREWGPNGAAWQDGVAPQP